MAEKPNGYWKDLAEGAKSAAKGLSLSLQHLRNAGQRHKPYAVSEAEYFQQDKGLVTLDYPKENLPVPEVGRYKLDCEIDDCIVCDKCAKICPVDCIEIEAIVSPEPIGECSDGSVKRIHAAKFDIDMAKCCYCGLCTTVCPTDCLIMTPDYDYSVDDITEMNFSFAKLSEEEAEEKRKEYEAFQAEKKRKAAEKKKQQQTQQGSSAQAKPAGGKPAFKPKTKKPGSDQADDSSAEEKPKQPKPQFKPKTKKPKGEDDANNPDQGQS